MNDADLDRAVFEASIGGGSGANLALAEIASRLCNGKRLSDRAIIAVAQAIIHAIENDRAAAFLFPKRQRRPGAPRKPGSAPPLVETLIVSDLRRSGLRDSISRKPEAPPNLYEEAARKLGALNSADIEREAERLRQSVKRARKSLSRSHPELGDKLPGSSRGRRTRHP